MVFQKGNRINVGRKHGKVVFSIVMVYFFSDCHFHNWEKLASINEDGVNTRLIEQIETVSQITEKLTGSDIVIYLGDWLHAQGKSINRDVYHLAYSAFEDIASRSKLIMIPGNHDVYKNRVGILRPFRKIAKVVDSPMVYTHYGENLYCIPYTARREEFLGMLKYLGGKEGPKILCSHVGISGAKIGFFEIPAKEPLRAKDILDECDLAILGHYHKHQTVHDFIHYVGSPYQIDFSEMGIEKGYMTWDGDKMEFHNLLSPKFWVVIINKRKDLEKFHLKRNPTDYYKLLVRTKKIHNDELQLGSNIVVIKELQKQTKKRIEAVAGDPDNLIDYYISNIKTDLNKQRLKIEARKVWENRNKEV